MPPPVMTRPESTTRARLIRHLGAISARRSIGTLPAPDCSTRSGSLRLVAARPSRVVDLRPRAESPGNQESVHVRALAEGIARQHGEARLRGHRAQRLGDEEGVELRIEAPRDGEHAVGRGEVDDLELLADINAEAKARLFRKGRHVLTPEEESKFYEARARMTRIHDSAGRRRRKSPLALHGF